MIRYIKSSKADQLSNALWSLVRPDSIRENQDTLYLFGWITDANGEGWLEAETDYTVRIHPDANLDKLIALIHPWINEGILTTDDLTGLRDTVANHKVSEEPLNVYGAFPQYFKDASKDRVTMIAEGLIDDPSLNLASPPSPIRVIPNAPRSKPI